MSVGSDRNYAADCDECGPDTKRSFLGTAHQLRAGAQADASRHDERAHDGEETAYVADYEEVGSDE